MRLQTFFLVLGASVALAAPAPAQVPHTIAAVHAAVLSMLRRTAGDAWREAPDSAAVWRDFVQCHADDRGRQACALRDGKPVTTIAIQMINADTASVAIVTFEMHDVVCGGLRIPIDPPQIGTALMQRDWRFAYHDRAWIAVPPVTSITC